MSDSLKDRIRNFWNAQPCNINHSKAEPGTAQFYADVTARRYTVEPHIPDFAGFTEFAGKTMLEIGTGVGTDSAEFARGGANIYGINIDQASVDLTAKRFEVEGLDGLFFRGDACEPETYSGLPAMDLVYSFGVIHHDPGIQTIINNIYDVLKPGGEFRFMVYAKNSWKQAMINKGFDQYEAQANCPWAQSFTKQEVADMLGDRFEIQQLSQDHCFMYNIPEYKKGNYVLEPWFEAMSDDMRTAVKKELGWHLLVKAVKK
jgi:SAM-dependent methyltransferase